MAASSSSCAGARLPDPAWPGDLRRRPAGGCRLADRSEWRVSQCGISGSAAAALGRSRWPDRDRGEDRPSRRLIARSAPRGAISLLMEPANVRPGQLYLHPAEPAHPAVLGRIRQQPGGCQPGYPARGAGRRHADHSAGRRGLCRDGGGGDRAVRRKLDAGAHDDGLSRQRSLRRGVVPADPRSRRRRGRDGAGHHHRHGHGSGHDGALCRRPARAGRRDVGDDRDAGGNRDGAGGQRRRQPADGRRLRLASSRSRRTRGIRRRRAWMCG